MPVSGQFHVDDDPTSDHFTSASVAGGAPGGLLPGLGDDIPLPLVGSVGELLSIATNLVASVTALGGSIADGLQGNLPGDGGSLPLVGDLPLVGPVAGDLGGLLPSGGGGSLPIVGDLPLVGGLLPSGGDGGSLPIVGDLPLVGCLLPSGGDGGSLPIVGDLPLAGPVLGDLGGGLPLGELHSLPLLGDFDLHGLL